MALSKYQDVYKLLETYDFHINTHLYPDLTCIICNNILNKAYQSPCGCRYCYSCVIDYSKSNKKFCPGNSDDCEGQTINIDQDLQFDHVANRKIASVKVNCPEKYCSFIDDLKNMVEHLDSHKLRCPFLDVGCNHLQIKSDSMKDHLFDESYSHSVILLDSMQNMKNEIEILKDDLQKKDDIIEKLKRDLLSVKEENYREIELLKKIVKVENKRSGTSFQERNFFSLEENESRTSLANEDSDISDNETSSNTGDLDRNLFMGSSSSIQNNCEGQDLAPFEWKIDGFLTRRQEAKSHFSKNIYSKPFYSHKNGYKIRLRINPNGFGGAENTHLSVFFSVIEGEHDDTLFWPMQRQVKIALIDQVSKRIFTSDKYELASIGKDFEVIFHKPSNRKENSDYYYYGTPNFIKLNLLTHNKKLIRNGSILLKCFVV